MQESAVVVLVSSPQTGSSEWDPPARWLPSSPRGSWGPACQTVAWTRLQVWRAPCRTVEISEFLRRICRRGSGVSVELRVLCQGLTLEGRAVEQRVRSSTLSRKCQVITRGQFILAQHFNGYLLNSSWAISVWTEVVDRPSEPWKRVVGGFYLIASGYRQWYNKPLQESPQYQQEGTKKTDLFSSPSSGLSWSLLWKWVCLYRPCTEVLERYWRSLGFLEAVWSSGWSWTNVFLHPHRYDSAVSSPELQVQSNVSKCKLSYFSPLDRPIF